MNTKDLSGIAIVITMKLQNTVGNQIRRDQKKVNYRKSRLIPRKIKETIHSLKNPNHIDKISCMLPEIWLIITASVKLYCLITLICLIILISHIAQLYLIHKFYCFCPVCIFSLSMSGIIIYVTRWGEKYLPKHSPIKHTCSWCDKLIVLWRLNRRAKIFLRISNRNTIFYLLKE